MWDSSRCPPPTEPVDTEAAKTEAVDVTGSLVITGAVNQPMGFVEADLRAMDVIKITAYHPKIVPVLVFERFGGLGLVAAQPVAALLVLIALEIFIFLRLSLLKEST